MARLRLSVTIGYGILGVVGLVFLLDVIVGAFGQLLNVLAAITGASFLASGVYGLRTQRTLREQPVLLKIILTVGILTLLAFLGLMALVLVALKNFS